MAASNEPEPVAVVVETSVSSVVSLGRPGYVMFFFIFIQRFLSLFLFAVVSCEVQSEAFADNVRCP